MPSLKLAPSNVSKTRGFILLPPTARSRNIVYIKYTSDNRKFNIIFLQKLLKCRVLNMKSTFISATRTYIRIRLCSRPVHSDETARVQAKTHFGTGLLNFSSDFNTANHHARK